MMRPQNRLDRLRSLREEIAALRAVKCRMSHERVLRGGERILPVASRLRGVTYERVGLCEHGAWARMLGCSHTTARVRLKQALDEMGAGGGEVAALAGELSRLDNEIHLLDHRKGEAEEAVARALEGAQRAAGWGGTDEDLASAEREVRELELIHDGYVEIVGALRDRIVAELDRLVGQAGPGRSPGAEGAYA